jgi:hypothetical protein
VLDAEADSMRRAMATASSSSERIFLVSQAVALRKRRTRENCSGAVPAH